MTDAAFIARMRSHAIAEIRTEYPYMKTSTLERVASDIVKECQRAISDHLRPWMLAWLTCLARSQEMQATKARSNFFTLPREIRDEIYELAVTPGVCSDVPDNCVVEEGAYHDRYFPSICHASRQVRQEALPIYLGKNNFTVWLTMSGPKDVTQFDIPLVREWAQSFGIEQVAKIKNLAMHLDIPNEASKKIGEAIAMRAGATSNDMSGSGAGDEIEMWDKNVVRRAFSLEDLGFSGVGEH